MRVREQQKQEGEEIVMKKKTGNSRSIRRYERTYHLLLRDYKAIKLCGMLNYKAATPNFTLRTLANAETRPKSWLLIQTFSCNLSPIQTFSHSNILQEEKTEYRQRCKKLTKHDPTRF